MVIRKDEKMQNEGIIEEVEVLDEVPEGIDEGAEAAEENNEVSEEIEFGDEEGIEEDVVSDTSGDYVAYDEQLNDIINELITQNEKLESLQAYVEEKDMTLFEKPLDKYTVTEGLLLLTFFVVVFAVIMKLIGGVITCKV